MGQAMGRKPRQRARESAALFIFEITDWAPSYHFSVNGLPDRDSAYSEITLVEVDAVCRYPEKKLSGRTAHFSIYGDRGLLEPAQWRRTPDWRPSHVAHLELPPSGGRCYARLPIDSVGRLMAGFAHKRFRYVSLLGVELKRGRSLCTSISFSTDEGLEDG